MEIRIKTFLNILILVTLFPLHAETKNASVDLKQAFKQIPKDSDFYYAIGGAAPLPPGVEFIEVPSLGEAQMVGSRLDCGLFKPEDALEQAIKVDTRLLFNRAGRVAWALQNNPLYTLQATNPRLFNLLSFATELSVGLIDQKVRRCEALEQASCLTPEVSSARALLTTNQTRFLEELQQKQKNGNVLTAMQSIEELAGQPLRFPCPCNPNAICSGENKPFLVISETAKCAYEKLTSAMEPNNIYSETFKGGVSAAQVVRDLVGDTELTKESFIRIPAKGIDYIYHLRAKQNLERLNKAVVDTRDSLEKTKGGATPDILRRALGAPTAGPLITASLLERLARDWKHKDEVIARIAFDKAYLEVHREGRLAKNLLDTALALPSIQNNPLASKLLEEGKNKLVGDLELLTLEVQAAEEMSRNLRMMVQKAEADDLRSSRIPTIQPKSGVCLRNGAFVDC
ncbi:MAG: hypothetical protein HY559_02690 [Gammaproteobacteria bacterium]|nr:hypothetical protein [Gammaproteobacteria bacterium]